MVKKFLALCLLAVALSHPLLQEGYTYEKTGTGAVVYSKQHSEDYMHSVVYLPDINEVSYNLISRFNARFRGESPSYSIETLSCEWGEGPDYFRFAPQFKGSAFIGKGPIKFSNHCFTSVTAQITDSTDTSVELSIVSSDSSGNFCYDSYFIAILDSVHLNAIFFSGTHKIEFANLSTAEVWDIKNNGVRIFVFCDGIWTLLEDLFMTLKMFLGGFTVYPWLPIIGSHTTQYMEKANVEFLEHSIGYTMEKRETYRVDLDESEIHSGDFLAITRLDGLDEIIMYGTGSHVGHSTMALWVQENGVRELYIVESQAGWYWPRTGIQRNKFSQWIKWAENASFNVVVLPLKPEVREKFDEEAAYEFFKKMEGYPYGYHNFLFGWIDTARENYPPILAPELLNIAFRLVEKIIPSAITSIYGEAMNKRLGTEGLQIPDLEVEAGKKGMSLLDVMTIVEEDGWWYSDGYSYVCSSFVLAEYKAAGILGDLDVQGTEFTPKDVYELNIFDTEYVRPQVCVDADPGIPYCQIIGDYRLNLGPTYGTIEPYSHMDEHCPSVAPDFVRPEGC